jgi:acyl dehydratase
MAERIAVGARFERTVVEGLTRTQIVQYAGASGDFNPLHTDERYATGVAGQPGVFAHGMLTMGMAGRAVTDLVGLEPLVHFGGRFTDRVWPGDTLTVRLTVVRAAQGLVELEVETVNQDGRTVFSGSAVATIRDGEVTS